MPMPSLSPPGRPGAIDKQTARVAGVEGGREAARDRPRPPFLLLGQVYIKQGRDSMAAQII